MGRDRHASQARGWSGRLAWPPTSDEIDARTSPDEQWRCYQAFEGGAIYWQQEYETRTAVVNTFRHGANWVGALRFSPDGNLLASLCLDHTVRIWDPVLAVPIGDAFTEPGHHLHAVGFAADDLLVLATHDDARTADVCRIPLGPFRLAHAELRREAAEAAKAS